MFYSLTLPHLLSMFVVLSMALSYSELINIGYEAPAGQMFSTTNDLAQLMMMLFRPELAANPDMGQVSGAVVMCFAVCLA